MNSSYVAPAIRNAFNCPHCGVFAHQSWLKIYAEQYNKGDFPEQNILDSTIEEMGKTNTEEGHTIANLLTQMQTGRIIIDQGWQYRSSYRIFNLDLSKCFSCDAFSVWRYGMLIYPVRAAATPNEDLPEDIKADFLEASAILDLSPRGSAALLRLCVQKICRHLGENGKTINDDIQSLVRRGLDATVQKALDAVRVIGNEAVHPGQMDLKDDVETANKLFTLVNYIANAMITQPKTINAIYGMLSPNQLAGIEKRDKPKAS